MNRIIPFSSVDGPGNRTSIFLQGCNIDCKYCHNPETRKLCINCGICVPHCPSGALSIRDKRVSYDRSLCINCDACIKLCPHDSSPKVELLSADEVYGRVRKQIPFIRGITVSGGECMLYPEFIEELFKLAKKDGLGTLIDSNGTFDFSKYPGLLSVCDGVMLDIKAYFNEAHLRVTGADNAAVLKNAAFLAINGKLFEVRCVIVPGLYEARENIYAMGEYLKPYLKYGDFRIKLIAYRPMGVREEYSHYKTPENELLLELADMLKGMGFRDIVIT